MSIIVDGVEIETHEDSPIYHKVGKFAMTPCDTSIDIIWEQERIVEEKRRQNEIKKKYGELPNFNIEEGTMELRWKERKRLWCGLPWTFTIYSFDDERLYIESGFLNQRMNEVRLYRVLDLTVTRSLIQRIFGLGSILINSSDKSLGNFEIKNIRNVKEVKELISRLVEEQRDKKRVSTREFMGTDSDDFDQWEV